MDCHRCENLRYAGCRYGRCSHRGHLDVVLKLEKGAGRKRPYNRQICPDFVMRKRCSNCLYWRRGKYFADGKTPATTGRCSLNVGTDAAACAMWRKGPTSSSKKTDGSASDSR